LTKSGVEVVLRQSTITGQTLTPCDTALNSKKEVANKMPSYILLIKWTQKGIETLKDSPQRVELARNNLKSVGGNLNEIYFVFGKYDMVGVAEAPSDEALAKAVLTIGSRGTASIQTLKAFSEAEGLAIINGLP
jgi:uncharacterized protein with GYD domain